MMIPLAIFVVLLCFLPNPADPASADLASPYLVSFGMLIWFLGGWGLLYCSLRPRIIVNGNQLYCYPRWKKAVLVNADEVAKRVLIRKADSSMAGFGLLGYAAANTPYAEVTYYMGEKPLITIYSMMKNAKLLDQMISVSIRTREDQKDNATTA